MIFVLAVLKNEGCSDLSMVKYDRTIASEFDFEIGKTYDSEDIRGKLEEMTRRDFHEEQNR